MVDFYDAYSHSRIIRNRLCVVTEGGSIAGLGIRGFKSAIKQIEASQRELRDSTRANLKVLRAGVRLWDSRHK